MRTAVASRVRAAAGGGPGASQPSAIRAATLLSLVYTLPAGLPRMSEQMASRATLMFAKDPRM